MQIRRELIQLFRGCMRMGKRESTRPIVHENTHTLTVNGDVNARSALHDNEVIVRHSSLMTAINVQLSPIIALQRRNMQGDATMLKLDNGECTAVLYR